MHCIKSYLKLFYDMKKIFILIILLSFSCNHSLENKNLNNLKFPCDFVNLKIEVLFEINKFYDKYSEFDNYQEVDMVDFSKLMKLWQKNDEIDFHVGLNYWDIDLKKCDNYFLIDSLSLKMNI